MEFIFELLFEIIVEGSIELSTHRKVPMIIRILALLLFLGIYGSLIVVLFLVGYDAAKSGDTGAAGMMYALDILFIVIILYVIRKKFKENRTED